MKEEQFIRHLKNCKKHHYLDEYIRFAMLHFPEGGVKSSMSLVSKTKYLDTYTQALPDSLGDYLNVADFDSLSFEEYNNINK